MKKPQPPKYYPLAMGNKWTANKYGEAMKRYKKRLKEYNEKQMLKMYCEFDKTFN